MMRNLNLEGLAKAVERALVKNAPGVLTGLGIAGMITTTILAVKATPKALRLIEAKKKEERKDKLAPVQTVKTAWKCYIPPAVTGALSIGCLVGANSVSGRRNAALATAYSLTESAFKTYKEKAVELIGETKEEKIRDEVAKERIRENPVSSKEVILTGKGETLCYDVISGRYFKSGIDKIERAQNEINRRMISEMCVSLNEFYDEIGLGHISVGNDLGWNVNRGFMEVSFSTQLAEGDTPCLVIDYLNPPEYDYNH